MSAVQASRCGPGSSVGRSVPATALEGYGQHEQYASRYTGWRASHTGHATLKITGLLHCCFWWAGSGSGATAIQLGEVHHAKRGATGAHSMRSGAAGAHSMRSGAAGALEQA